MRINKIKKWNKIDINKIILETLTFNVPDTGNKYILKKNRYYNCICIQLHHQMYNKKKSV